MDSELEKYIGKIIRSFNFSKEILTFGFMDDSVLDLHAVGDCCSESWFEQIAGQEALKKDAKLLEITLIDLDVREGDDGNGEVIQYYGLKIKTSKGYCDIDMRNSSNGYYGGYISISSPDLYSYSIFPEYKESE